MKLIERTLLLDLVKRGRMKRAIYYILAFALCSCAVQRPRTSEEFVRDIQKDIPFKVSELKAVSGRENTYLFRSDGYISLLPDYEVDSEGASMIYQTTFAPTHHTQPSNIIWRNIVINKRDKRALYRPPHPKRQDFRLCLCAAIGDGALQRLRHVPLGCE